MSDVQGPHSCASHPLHAPSLEEVAALFGHKLGEHFEEVDVGVVECPNLTAAPFHLAGAGLCGNPSVADVGGVPYLVPLAQTNRRPYDLLELRKQMGYKEAFFVGAACGPFHVVGTNCELMPNLSVAEKEDGKEVVVNETHVAKLENNTRGYTMTKCPSSEFGLLGNLFCSEGKPGKVLRVRVKKRVGTNNFVSTMREILAQGFVDLHVSLGGVFLLKTGKAKLHVMPAFSETPLTSDQDVDNWLKYFVADAPLICLSVFHSKDPGLDLRIEHTHCFSTHGDGGHYHYDTTPEVVEYEGYFNVAQQLFRVDPPAVTHQVGRD